MACKCILKELIGRENYRYTYTVAGRKKTACECGVEKVCHFRSNCEINEPSFPKSNLSVSSKLKNTKQRKKKVFSLYEIGKYKQ